MKAEINLITIWTDNMEAMKRFYQETLGFTIQTDLGQYVEFNSSGVRFSLCERQVMYEYSGQYQEKAVGQAFELAFPCESPADVDASFERLVAMGATPIHAPQNMPWQQRTALFADPDGNIHEIFAALG